MFFATMCFFWVAHEILYKWSYGPTGWIAWILSEAQQIWQSVIKASVINKQNQSHWKKTLVV